LELVLQLLQLGPHFLYLLLQGSLGFLKFMNLQHREHQWRGNPWWKHKSRTIVFLLDGYICGTLPTLVKPPPPASDTCMPTLSFPLGLLLLISGMQFKTEVLTFSSTRL
jgi:hypothetical protein